MVLILVAVSTAIIMKEFTKNDTKSQIFYTCIRRFGTLKLANLLF